MYSAYYSLGTSGHRVASSYGFVPNPAYGSQMFGPATMMPPPPPAYYQPHLYAPPMAPAPQQAPVTGGISAVLEYEPATMSAFMCWCIFGMLSQNRSPSKDFETSVMAILNATRLPRSTILVSLEYTNQRFMNASRKTLSDQDMYMILVIALVLANKFNDDNTFTNKSWSSASGIKVASINTEESLWLAAVNWRLNVIKLLPEISTLEECWKTWLQKYTYVPLQATLPSAYPPTAAPHQRYYNSIPSSPAYTTDSSVYGYSSPSIASPIRYNDRAPMPVMGNYHYTVQTNPYAQPPQPSIWSQEPAKPAPLPGQGYYGYVNPYYNNNNNKNNNNCLTTC